ncbi:MAG: hypothetical protein ACLVLG_11725, partial [Anaerovoracaceae bacterium]
AAPSAPKTKISILTVLCKHQTGCHGRHRIAAKVILLRQSFSVKQDTVGEISMKNFKELGSKKEKFLISAGGILVITL